MDPSPLASRAYSREFPEKYAGSTRAQPESLETLECESVTYIYFLDDVTILEWPVSLSRSPGLLVVGLSRFLAFYRFAS